ncbi:2-succinyl-5-enolpyruvyl-6-hydroxy-3-cyclohexene-1-carboxylic-acid synthase [Arenibacter sp. GZD96]|uniref:2-succinyl-5-enolpyruvyl-6-hydroxy-3- cyclohexene-1-carboxylic-acid synthase n=1 Tax=Aurantibrevibacter litoralis TaxID=3106030 RepID=UPI002AFF33CE|nr:2-succinyl-5-enolpyruvyl-6-hydroxy-3-cyclohexene-1-carboxylic-acid synthase [Arenibacter sp. GZD-96]MEA1786263.1 2-succinyl-5-enolpyruvyl-6-hydroxy-3-cyclohexene-1-carboxylic-acid synthase [Arenibacter sp. GZD-96]
MKYSTIPAAQSVVDHCKANALTNIVISPGSRNAPLIIAFTEDPYFNCFSIVDERCAAFFALGIAQQQRKPVALVCTSGSAVVNYYPAVTEAFYSDIPLVILSADRPFYMVDIGDGQTIRQNGVFNTHIGYATHLKLDAIHATDKIKAYAPQLLSSGTPEACQAAIQQYNDTELNRAFRVLRDTEQPVHINIPFEEPLYNIQRTKTVHTSIEIGCKKPIETNESLAEFSTIWNTSAKKMVLIGTLNPDSIEAHYLEKLGGDPSVLVFTETTSNVHHPHFFPSIDSIIAPIEKSTEKEELFKKLQPEVLLTFGGLIVSKKIKAFLRQYQPKAHWHVHEYRANDTFFSLTKHFKRNINSFLSDFLKGVEDYESTYFSYWNKVKLDYEQKRKHYVATIPFSDMSVFNSVLQSIPDAYQLQLANSSTVRYSQLFPIAPSVQVYCNRGTSGIDGSTSTAIGSAWYAKTPTLFITGDLSFFYDSNGLWNRYIRSDFRIILINNQGGGIFRILPGKEDTARFETFFETTHTLDASQLCAMHKIAYYRADNSTELSSILDVFYTESGQPKLLEIHTPRLINNKILLGYFDFIS